MVQESFKLNVSIWNIEWWYTIIMFIYSLYYPLPTREATFKGPQGARADGEGCWANLVGGGANSTISTLSIRSYHTCQL